MGCNVPILGVEVLALYERDTYAWTEGLQWYSGYLYESAGMGLDLDGHDNAEQKPTVSPGLYRLKLSNGLATTDIGLQLPKDLEHGEGLARAGSYLYQLVEDSSTLLAYPLPLNSNSTPIHLRRAIPNPPDRWGFCYDAQNDCYYVSNGSDILEIYTTFEDLLNNQPAQSVKIECNGNTLPAGYYLNDLEVVNGYIYAAVWLWQDDTSSLILKIDTETYSVNAKIDASELRKGLQPQANALNGIAYHCAVDGEDIFWITGKLWSRIYEVRFT